MRHTKESCLRLAPPSIPHSGESSAEQEQGGGFGDGIEVDVVDLLASGVSVSIPDYGRPNCAF